MEPLEPTFDSRGQFVIDTDEQLMAALYATLRNVTIIPQAYYSRGPEFHRDEMYRIATDLLFQISQRDDSKHSNGGK